jgi:hypothetical protein
MCEKKPPLKIVDKLGDSFRLDGDTAVFSVGAFLRINNLPDDAQLRMVVIAEVREIFPDVRVLEEEN